VEVGPRGAPSCTTPRARAQGRHSNDEESPATTTLQSATGRTHRKRPRRPTTVHNRTECVRSVAHNLRPSVGTGCHRARPQNRVQPARPVSRPGQPRGCTSGPVGREAPAAPPLACRPPTPHDHGAGPPKPRRCRTVCVRRGAHRLNRVGREAPAASTTSLQANGATRPRSRAPKPRRGRTVCGAWRTSGLNRVGPAQPVWASLAEVSGRSPSMRRRLHASITGVAPARFRRIS
jgi:hypothetical protein